MKTENPRTEQAISIVSLAFWGIASLYRLVDDERIFIIRKLLYYIIIRDRHSEREREINSLGDLQKGGIISFLSIHPFIHSSPENRPIYKTLLVPSFIQSNQRTKSRTNTFTWKKTPQQTSRTKQNLITQRSPPLRKTFSI